MKLDMKRLVQNLDGDFKIMKDEIGVKFFYLIRLFIKTMILKVELMSFYII